MSRKVNFPDVACEMFGDSWSDHISFSKFPFLMFFIIFKIGYVIEVYANSMIVNSKRLFQTVS